MDASSVTSAAQRPGRGRVFDSIVDAIGDTPIVRLRKLPEVHGVSATILAKLEYLQSRREREGPHWRGDGDRDGEGRRDQCRHRADRADLAGNTGIALAFVAASRGYRLKLVMPESMSIERRKMLAFLGAEIILTPAAQGMKGSIATAEELVRTTPNAVMPQQFKNLANPEIHRRTTAEEIWNDHRRQYRFLCRRRRHRRHHYRRRTGAEAAQAVIADRRRRAGGKSGTGRRATHAA